ncbi:MAG: ABC transporter ATP-binding protein [Phycisphaerales bacterium]|nr:ABC transporter ATP-binding protein [Phycisphaerales bacterium]
MLSPQPATEAAIRTIGLTHRFGKLTAVRELNLTIPRGATYGFIGLNGAGKSTTIRMLTGLLAPTAGRAIIDNIDITQDPIAALARIGYIPDRPTAYAWMRVGEVLSFARSMWPGWNDALAADLLARYRLDPRQKVGKLSKGTAAKLSLLLALAHDPEILILDEPTDGLDAIAREEFYEQIISAACDRPRTILLSSHALNEVQRIADHIGIIHEGRLIMQGRAEDLIARTKRIHITFENGTLEKMRPAAPPPPDGTVWARTEAREWILTVQNFSDDTLHHIRAAGPVRSLNVLDLSLDDVFKDIVRGQEARA